MNKIADEMLERQREIYEVLEDNGFNYEMNEFPIIDRDLNLIFRTEYFDEAVAMIYTIYKETSSVSLWEMLAGIKLPEFTMEDVVEIYGTLMNKVEEDKLIRVNFEGEKIMEHFREVVN